MKKLILTLSLSALAAFGQTVLLPTTLSTAVSDSSGQKIVVASATNINAPSATSGVTNLYVDKELMEVEAVNSTTITVRRGVGGTSAAPHVSGALVFVGTPSQFFTAGSQGACTRSKELVLPRIDVKSGVIYDCLGGQWTPSDIPSGTATAARWRVYSPEPGGTAYTSLNTTGTALASTTLFCTEVWLPTQKLLTGIAILNGTTVGTDNHYVVLYDSAGNALANSALAGAVSANASTYQAYAFTSKYFAIGPAQYFACVQSNGSTDTLRMAVTGVNDNVLTKGQTSATFGTVPALTVPTTFTTAVGPYVYLY